MRLALACLAMAMSPMVVFTFESQYSDDEMSAALDFAYSGGVDVEASASVSYEDMVSQSNITVTAL